MVINDSNTQTQTITNTSSQTPTASSPANNKPQASSSSLSKEFEVPQLAGTEVVQEISHEVEIPKEVERVGVTAVRETIELPPDVKKLGVTTTGPGVPVTTTTLPTVILPITDQQIVVGLHTHIANALRWLAVWCLKKLQKAHVMLKIVHGKVIRVKTK